MQFSRLPAAIALLMFTASVSAFAQLPPLAVEPAPVLNAAQALPAQLLPREEFPDSGQGEVASAAPAQGSAAQETQSSAAPAAQSDTGTPDTGTVQASSQAPAPTPAVSSRATQMSSIARASSSHAISSVQPVASSRPASQSSASSRLPVSSGIRSSDAGVPVEAASAEPSSPHYLPEIMEVSSSSASSMQAVASVWSRETWGYSVPVIDPGVIFRWNQVSLAPQAIAGNLFLALLVAFVIGLSGVMLRRLIQTDRERVMRILVRLPFQMLLTLVILWVIRLIIPGAAAQEMMTFTSSASLVTIPIVAVLFFLVVGTSNFLFNAMIVSHGSSFVPLALREGRLIRSLWFVLIMVLLYGVVGAHINPEFSLFPGAQTGIILVATLGIIISVCCKDVLLLLLARRWKMSGWFQANLGGFAVAVACVVLSRVFALNPGYIYGVPAALIVASMLFHESEGFFEFTGVLWLLVLALIMWLLGPLLQPYPVLFDLSNLLFVIMAEDAFFELLPLPSLPGESIFRWKKALWFLQFVTVLFFLFHTLLNPQGTVRSLQETPPTATALVILGCYAAGVFLLWAYVMWGRGRGKKPEEAREAIFP